jgi:hypothetical protein
VKLRTTLLCERAGYTATFNPKTIFEHKSIIGRELSPSIPEDPRFIQLAVDLNKENAVSVGVRLFEEVPHNHLHPSAAVSPIEFYRQAGERIATKISKPKFYVFCTHRFPVLDSLQLPGEVIFVTHDDGYVGSRERLWLFSRSKQYIVSHSSFYWWGAWLSEFYSDKVHVIASSSFPRIRTIPDRWEII